MKLNIYEIYSLCCGLWRAMRMNAKPTIRIKDNQDNGIVLAFEDMHFAMKVYKNKVHNNLNPTLWIEDTKYLPE